MGGGGHKDDATVASGFSCLQYTGKELQSEENWTQMVDLREREGERERVRERERGGRGGEREIFFCLVCSHTTHSINAFPQDTPSACKVGEINPARASLQHLILHDVYVNYTKAESCT